jgi:hypothetical protein
MIPMLTSRSVHFSSGDDLLRHLVLREDVEHQTSPTLVERRQHPASA